uniref:Uncharacterized protein n=1 Tax=Cacopsylla melanoneura TaxID=428564 RepID=A0A8D8M3Q4_9HEMI
MIFLSGMKKYYMVERSYLVFSVLFFSLLILKIPRFPPPPPPWIVFPETKYTDSFYFLVCYGFQTPNCQIVARFPPLSVILIKQSLRNIIQIITRSDYMNHLYLQLIKKIKK